MPTDWMPGYEKKLAEKKNVDALVDFTLADAPPRIQRMPPWLMKLLVLLLVSCSRQYRQMLGLLHQNLREWREIARLDSSYENYREIAGGVLLMYGGKSDSKAVTLAMERLAAILPHSETKKLPRAFDDVGVPDPAKLAVQGPAGVVNGALRTVTEPINDEVRSVETSAGPQTVGPLKELDQHGANTVGLERTTDGPIWRPASSKLVSSKQFLNTHYEG